MPHQDDSQQPPRGELHERERLGGIVCQGLQAADQQYERSGIQRRARIVQRTIDLGRLRLRPDRQ